MTSVRFRQNLNTLPSSEANAGHVTHKIGPLYFKGAGKNCENLGLFTVHLQLLSTVFFGRPQQYFVAKKNLVCPGLSNIVHFYSFQFLLHNLML